MKQRVDQLLSFTAADSIPVKLIGNDGAAKLRPLHVQWLPTNRCNLSCRFCSCSERNRGLQMEMPTARMVIVELAELGCRAVTITGGGESLMHPDIVEMIEWFTDNDIAVGLVTNGLLLDRLSIDTLSQLTWCRISNGDDRELNRDYQKILERAVAAEVDWAFSHVVGRQPNFDEIRRIVEFANQHEFTHVRIVSDISDAANVDLGPVEERLKGIDELVIYQGRQHPVRWEGDCWIGYVKPVIAPDWSIYPCCGVQYALDPPSNDLPPSMAMGSALDLAELYDSPQSWRFPCVRCYYTQYNKMLAAMVSDVRHREFV